LADRVGDSEILTKLGLASRTQAAIVAYETCPIATRSSARAPLARRMQMRDAGAAGPSAWHSVILTALMR
jgi:hypothetical protein